MKITSTRLYLIITLLVTIWCAGIVAAPVLKHYGHVKSAEIIYSFFSRVCHQHDSSSFHFEGEKSGVCVRCSAVYFGFLAGLLLIPLFGALKRMYVPNKTMLFAAALPMLIDVLLSITSLHTSTATTRVITGVFLGAALPWWILPVYIEAFLQLIEKRKINHQIQE